MKTTTRNSNNVIVLLSSGDEGSPKVTEDSVIKIYSSDDDITTNNDTTTTKKSAITSSSAKKAVDEFDDNEAAKTNNSDNNSTDSATTPPAKRQNTSKTAARNSHNVILLLSSGDEGSPKITDSVIESYFSDDDVITNKKISATSASLKTGIEKQNISIRLTRHNNELVKNNQSSAFETIFSDGDDTTYKKVQANITTSSTSKVVFKAAAQIPNAGSVNHSCKVPTPSHCVTSFCRVTPSSSLSSVPHPKEQITDSAYLRPDFEASVSHCATDEELSSFFQKYLKIL